MGIKNVMGGSTAISAQKLMEAALRRIVAGYYKPDMKTERMDRLSTAEMARIAREALMEYYK